MKKWFWSTLVLIILILSEVSWPIENPSVRNPVDSGTVPPSSISSGLIRTPNPMDASSNLVITGNVTGGKHFRGHVPYGSTTNFRASLGSSSLDSFLRYSADPTKYGQQAGGYRSFYSPAQIATSNYRPFFSPSGTVTIARPGFSDVLTSASIKVDQRVDLTSSGLSTDALNVRAVPSGQTLIGVNTSADQLNVWLSPKVRQGGIASRASLLSRTPQELEKIISNEIRGVSFQDGELRGLRNESSVLIKSETEKYQEIAEQLRNKTKPATSNLTKDKTTEIAAPGLVVPDAEVPALPQTRPFLQGEQRARTFASDRAELDRLISEAEKKAQDSGLAVTGTKTDMYYLKNRDLQDESDDVYMSRTKVDDGYSPRRTSSSSEDKYDWYIQAAKVYLKQGRYYRAADCFTMASIYLPPRLPTRAGAAGKPDPHSVGLAYLGKSHALFAAGEYMTSALFLSRALQLKDEFVRHKIDLVDIVGGKDKFARRIANIKECLQISDAPELQFLLGYVYYQTARAKPWTGSQADFVRLDEAKMAIESAYKNLPKSKAVIAVKKAVDDAINEK